MLSVFKAVRVPSNEHAAEVIGPNGAKINLLQSSTNSTIITPNPGADPVFNIKAPNSEALRICEDEIKRHCDHFDLVRSQKRDIMMPRESVVTTFRVLSKQVKRIIGNEGTIIKKIEELFNVYIKSPDRSTEIATKEPIFIISGKQKNVNESITFMKLVLYKCGQHIRLTLEESYTINPILANNVNPFIDVESILVLLSKELYSDSRYTKIKLITNFVPKSDILKYYCPLCFTYNARKAKAFPCKHFVCCANCIVPLYRNAAAKCNSCSMKIDQFEILSFWER